MRRVRPASELLKYYRTLSRRQLLEVQATADAIRGKPYAFVAEQSREMDSALRTAWTERATN